MKEDDLLEEPSVFDEPFTEEPVDEPVEDVREEPEQEPEAKAQDEPEKEDEPSGEPEHSDKEENFSKLRTKLNDTEKSNQMLADRLERLQTEFERKQEAETLQQQQQLQMQEEERFEDDPSTYLKNQNQRIQDQVNQLQQQGQQFTQQQQIEQHIMGMTQQFAGQQKDYPQALDYMKERRFKEYEVQNVPQAQWQQAWDKEAWDFSVTQSQQGKNPAEVAYQMAKVYGYTGQTTETDGSNKDAETKLAQIEKGQQAAKDLGSGSAPAETIDGTKPIAEMNEKEFDEYFAKVAQSARKESGGGGYF